MDRSIRDDLILKQIVEKIEELRFCQCNKCDWINLDPEEHFIDFYLKKDPSSEEQSDEAFEAIPIFDVKNSNLRRLSLTNREHGFDEDIVDFELCEKYGINCDAWVPNSMLEYSPVGRQNPIDFTKLEYLRIFEITIPGANTRDSREIRKLGQKFYTECDIFSINCSQNEHTARTDDYNKKLTRALKSKFLCQAIDITDSVLGLARSPFDSPMNPNVQQFFNSLSTVEQGNLLTDPKKWLHKNEWIDEITDLSSWAESTISAVHSDLWDAISWFDKSIHKYHTDLNLGDQNYWTRELGEPTRYIECLKQFAALLKISSEMKAKFLQKTLWALQSAVKDLGYLFSTIIERYLSFSSFLKTYFKIKTVF